MTIEVVTASQVVAEQAAQAKEQAEKESAAAVQKDGAKQGDSETPEQDKEEEGKEATDAKEGDEEEIKEEPKKGPSGYKKKYLREAEARALAERENATLKELLQKGKPEEKPAAKEKPEGEPNPDDYGSHAEYIRAVSEWTWEQKEKAAEAKRKEAEAKATVETRLSKFNQGFQAFAKEHTDAPEVIEDAMAEQPLSLAVQDILLDSENGQELSYQLAKNLDEWKRINSLPPLAAARELGKFEASLSKPEKQEIKQTKAPAPIRPVGGSAAAPKEKTLKDVNAETSQAEYEAIRAKQLARKQA